MCLEIIDKCMNNLYYMVIIIIKTNHLIELHNAHGARVHHLCTTSWYQVQSQLAVTRHNPLDGVFII